MNYLDSLNSSAPVVGSGCIPNDIDLEQSYVAEIPPDHYSKRNPGAGWAGHRHPKFGGYLNNLKQNVWEDGKEADYGDDVRWGAQVYLDQI